MKSIICCVLFFGAALYANEPSACLPGMAPHIDAELVIIGKTGDPTPFLDEYEKEICISVENATPEECAQARKIIENCLRERQALLK